MYRNKIVNKFIVSVTLHFDKGSPSLLGTHYMSLQLMERMRYLNLFID